MEVACPKCKKNATWENNPYRPFCSKECKQRDLGSWASEEYRIPETHAGREEITEGVPPKSEE